MAKQNFFVDGGNVQAQEGAIYLRRDADEQLLDLCRQGTFAYVLTARQMGKSSLMVNTAEQLTEEGVRTAEIDLTRIGKSVTMEEWYLGILYDIRQQLGLRQEVISWWSAPERKGLSTAQRLLLFFEQVVLAEVHEPVVIFVDEIEITLRLDFTDDFFAAVRSIHNARSGRRFERLSFVLIGAATPDSLIRDPQLTPFNIGRGVLLSDFTLEEALPLADGFRLPRREARRVLARVLDWSGGHPYLTQRLCRSIAEGGRDAWSDADVDDVVAQVFFGDKIDDDKNLRYVRQMLLTSGLNREELLSTYREILSGRRPALDEERSLIKSHLKLSGVVKREGSALRVRNDIYREVFDEAWVRNNTPINWARRLTRAAAAVIVTLMVLSIPLAAYAWKKKGEAEEALQEQMNLTLQLQDTNVKLDAAKNEAVKQSELAQERARQETLAKEDAEAQRALALKESEKARESARAAEVAQREAEKARGEAQRARWETVISKLILRDESLANIGGNRLMDRVLVAKEAYLQATQFEAQEGGARGGEALSVLAYRNLIGSAALLPSWQVVPFKGKVNSLCFTEDGQGLVAIDDDDMTVQTWDFNTRQLTSEHSGMVVSYRNGGRHVALKGGGASVIIRDQKGGREFTVGDTAGDPQNRPVVLFSPRGDYVLVCKCPDSRMYEVWHTADGQKVADVESSSPTLRYWFSPDGAYLYMVDTAGSLRVFETRTGKTVFDYAEPPEQGEAGRLREPAPGGRDTEGTVGQEFEAAALSRNRTFLAISNLRAVAVWNLSDAKSPKRVANKVFGFGRIKDVWRALSISNDGRLLSMFGGSEKTIDLWALKSTDEEPRPGTDDEPRPNVDLFEEEPRLSIGLIDKPDGAYFSEGTSRFVTFSANAMQVWDVQTGLELYRAGEEEEVEGRCVSPDGNSVATLNKEGLVRVWEIAGDRSSVRRIVNYARSSMDTSRDVQFVAIVNSETNIAEVWDMNVGRLVATRKFEQPFEAVAFSPDGSTIAVMTGDGKDHTVWLWPWKDRAAAVRKRATFAAENDVNISLSRGGEFLSVLIGGPEPSIRIWATGGDDGTAGRSWVLGVKRAHNAYFFMNAGRLVVTTSEGTQLWDFIRDQPVGHVIGRSLGEKRSNDSEGPSNLYAYDGAETYIVSYSERGPAIEIAETATGKLLARLENLKGLKNYDMSYNGDLVATAENGVVRLWDWKRQQVVSQIKYEAEHVTFSWDGRYFAAAAGRDPTRVWDISRPGEPVEVARIQPNNGASAYFSHDAKYLYTFQDGMIQMWHWKADELLSEATDLLSKKKLSTEEWRNYLLPSEMQFLQQRPVK